jgi:hypothetical protein
MERGQGRHCGAYEKRISHANQNSPRHNKGCSGFSPAARLQWATLFSIALWYATAKIRRPILDVALPERRLRQGWDNGIREALFGQTGVVVAMMMMVMVMVYDHDLRLRRIRHCEAEDEDESKQNLFHNLSILRPEFEYRAIVTSARKPGSAKGSCKGHSNNF